MRYLIIISISIVMHLQTSKTFSQKLDTIHIKNNVSICGFNFKTATMGDVKKKHGIGSIKRSKYWLGMENRKNFKRKNVKLFYKDIGIEFQTSYIIKTDKRISESYQRNHNVKFTLFNSYKDKKIETVSITSKLPIEILLENSDTLLVELGKTTKGEIISKYGKPQKAFDENIINYYTMLFFLEENQEQKQIVENSNEDLNRKVVKINLQHFNK